MAVNKKNEGNGLVKSVFIAYLIVILHILLIAGLALLVLFFRGIVNYMAWVFLGGLALIILSLYYFYRRIRAGGSRLKETLNSPAFNGRPVEVSFLGGLASFRIGAPIGDLPALGGNSNRQVHQLEAPETIRIRELTELARLLENELITPEEYKKAKQQIFKS
ncbi:MAG: SHOCT domain-containing protein [Desulfobacterales bacterium]|nr:SHOCT domain-containing protein [Desulfobacterales bacterium]